MLWWQIMKIIFHSTCPFMLVTQTQSVCLTCRRNILLCPVIEADVLILIIVLGNSEEVLSWKLICNGVPYGSLWGGNPLKTKESLIYPLDQRVCQLRGGDRVKKGKIWALLRESAPQGTLEIHLLCLCVCVNEESRVLWVLSRGLLM